MRVAIMQPTYLPWLGYFALMDRVDCFILLDTVQFARRSWQQRNQIKTATGPLWLTVPVRSKAKRDQRIMDVEIETTERFPRNHIRSIEVNYARSPAYADYAGDLFDAIDAGHQQLAGLTIGVIRWLRQALGIGTDLRLASEIGGAGHRADLLADLCRKVGAREYVSPPGSRAYLDDSDAFEQAGIPVRYHAYAHPTYRQAHGEFLPYMSVVDQMMNEGDRSLAIIRSGYR